MEKLAALIDVRDQLRAEYESLTRRDDAEGDNTEAGRLMQELDKRLAAVALRHHRRSLNADRLREASQDAAELMSQLFGASVSLEDCLDPATRLVSRLSLALALLERLQGLSRRSAPAHQDVRRPLA